MLKATQKLRVEWSHCDPAGIIFNPHYYIWMDQGSHRLFDAAGFPFTATVGKDGFRGCPLVASGADYIRPVRFGDIIELTSTVLSFGTKSFRIGHEFSHNGKPVAKGFEVRIWGANAADDPERLIAVAVPEQVKTLLSKEALVDTTLK